MNHSLATLIYQNLTNFSAIELSVEGHSRAAVAFTLIDCCAPGATGNLEFGDVDCAQAAFILTTRSTELSNHAGQRAYPGGRIDPGESVAQAALRELDEEVGLQLNADAVLGRLDDYATHSGFVISPVVVWGGSGVRLTPNPQEVSRIHRVPLQELTRAEAPILEQHALGEAPVLKMPLGEEWFAAPSAAIAYQFREVALFGRHTRVAHFEQPLFARQ